MLRDARRVSRLVIGHNALDDGSCGLQISVHRSPLAGANSAAVYYIPITKILKRYIVVNLKGRGAARQCIAAAALRAGNPVVVASIHVE